MGFMRVWVLLAPAVTLLSLQASAQRYADLVAPTQINEAEAIIEPFWDPALSDLTRWAITDGKPQGLEVKHTWSSVEFSWQRKPAAGPALSMTRTFSVDCSDYDRLLVAATLPEGDTLHISALTDLGERAYVSEPAPREIVEHSVDLQGAHCLLSLTLEVSTSREGPAAGWFQWIGLQSTARLPRYLKRWDYSGMRWEGQLQDNSYEPRFEPLYGIFLTPEELDLQRTEHQMALARGDNALEKQAEALRQLDPEKGIHEFVSSGGRTNEVYGRTRDAEMASIGAGKSIAVTALVLKDKALLRVAARCALSMALSDKWDDGFVSRFPGSAWDVRGFRRSYTCNTLAQLLDLAGEMLTAAGRQYILRRLAEEGVGLTNYPVWRYDYILHSNQIGYVTRGRLYAYLVIEREWPRVKPYTDLAVHDVQQTLRNVIMPDGGFLEPPSYFGATISMPYEMLGYYARARSIPLGPLIPSSLKRSDRYAAVMASTVPEMDAIPLGDADPGISESAMLQLASMKPRGYWTTLCRKRISPETGERLSPDLKRLFDALPERGPRLPAFIFLPTTGHMASLRKWRTSQGTEYVKVFIPGNYGAGAHDHEHEDRGSFVLEFAGEPFAIDPGICDYENPLHVPMKQCQYHNMLVPVGMPERAHPDRPILADVKPKGSGDRRRFHARMDVTPGWHQYYRQWTRTWNSPSPDILVIRDEYALVSGDAVEFYWQTGLPCEIQGNTIVVHGKRGHVTIEGPGDCSVRIDDLERPGKTVQHRIVFRKNALSGIIEVTAQLGLD